MAERDLPLYGRASLPGDDAGWRRYRKTSLTRAIRIEGPFRVSFADSLVSFRCEDGYLAIDARGYPYAIAAEEFERTYVPADHELRVVETSATSYWVGAGADANRPAGAVVGSHFTGFATMHDAQDDDDPTEDGS